MHARDPNSRRHARHPGSVSGSVTPPDDPGPPAIAPRRVLVVLVLAGVIASAALALVPELGDLLPRSADQQAVADVVERTIVANQSAGIPFERDADGRVSSATVQAMRVQVRKVAAELFTESYRDTWIARTDAVIDVETSSEPVFAGGAYDFTRWQIAVIGDRAAVKVRCRIFLEMAQTFEGRRHRAENIVDYELTLERVDGSWLVAGEASRFAPGGGP
jgi:hypothetical protein